MVKLQDSRHATCDAKMKCQAKLRSRRISRGRHV